MGRKNTDLITQSLINRNESAPSVFSKNRKENTGQRDQFL